VSGRPQQKKVSTHTMNNSSNGSKKMNLMHEDLARAQMSARLGEARQRRRGHQMAQVRRLGRKAENAALQARLAVARVL